MGVVLWTIAALFVAASAVAGRAGDSVVAGLVETAATAAATVFLAAALVHWMRVPLARWAERVLRRAAAPGVIRSLPPRDVLEVVLARVFPDEFERGELVTWLLGGPGRRADGGDIVVSRETSVHYRIESVSDTRCITRQAVSYRYADLRDNYLFVLFATTDREVLRLVGDARVHPLCESWVLASEEELDRFAPTLRKNLLVEMTYTDAGGRSYVAGPEAIEAEEVGYRSYDRYLTVPDGFDRDSVRIFVLDLHDLVDHHVVESIEAVTLHSSNVANSDRGFVVWTPPHPCHVTTVTYDLSDLIRPAGGLVYQVFLSTAGAYAQPGDRWRELGDSISVPVHAPMFPGHTVTLVYRAGPADEEGAGDGRSTGP